MKGLFIMFIMFSLFISGCELIEEEGSQINDGPQMSWPNEEDMPFALPRPYEKNKNPRPATTICQNFAGDCDVNTPGYVQAICEDNTNLQCEESCFIPYNPAVCGVDEGLGNCYCIGDGECHTEFGEPATSIDCQACTSGLSEPCPLIQIPTQCGECNEGEKTCTNGQWGECIQQTFPVIPEICDNGQDDDCDCNPDYVDEDCLTHLECDGNMCIEVDGEGEYECTTPNTLDPACSVGSHLECNANDDCISVPGPGSDICTVNADCVTHLECDGASGLCIEVVGDAQNQNGCYEVDQTCSIYVEDCEITGAYWQEDSSGDTVTEGTIVSLTIVGNGFCDGQSLASIRIYDEDYWTGDDHCCYQTAGSFEGNVFTRSWVTARCCVDEMDEVDPQFRFIAKLEEDESEFLRSERLRVTIAQGAQDAGTLVEDGGFNLIDWIRDLFN